MPLWLLWAASEYVLATRDVAFLDEEIPPGRCEDPPARKDTVATSSPAATITRWNDVGVGQHGVMRMLNDDWNDGLLGTFGDSAHAGNRGAGRKRA